MGCEHKVSFLGNRLITLQELEKIIETGNMMQKPKEEHRDIYLRHSVSDYAYPEKFSWIFRYCPECGEKIDWETIRGAEREKIMKFRNKKTGEIVTGVKELHSKVCYEHALLGCVLSEYYCRAKNPVGSCFDLACINPAKFASLVGWEIIYENSKWTKQEIEDAKAIQRMFGKDNFTHVQKDEDGWPNLMDGDGKYQNVGWCSIGMEKDMFPSLEPGQTVTLDEIIGGAE